MLMELNRRLAHQPPNTRIAGRTVMSVGDEGAKEPELSLAGVFVANIRSVTETVLPSRSTRRAGVPKTCPKWSGISGISGQVHSRFHVSPKSVFEERTGQLAGTRRFSSSCQFSTTIIRGGSTFPSMSAGAARRKRRPSRLTAY